MRGLIWIVLIALLGGAALFLAWRLVPPVTREGARPRAAEPAPVGSAPAELHTPVEPEGSALRTEPVQVVEAPAAPPPSPAGLEEGGAAQAARPLPDFSAKYAGRLRSDWWLAAGELETSIDAGRKQLGKAESADLEARLTNAPRPAEPTAKVAALLAQIDELAWLRQQLAQTVQQRP